MDKKKWQVHRTLEMWPQHYYPGMQTFFMASACVLVSQLVHGARLANENFIQRNDLDAESADWLRRKAAEIIEITTAT